jgi:multidrug efflux system membrane fusion protein
VRQPAGPPALLPCPRVPALARVLAPILAGLGAACSGEAPYETPPVPVRVTTVEQRAVAAGLRRYSATIRPATQVELAFRVGGYVEELLRVSGAGGRARDVQEGDWVTAGTVLVRLRAADYVAKVTQAQSQLDAARSVADAARSQLAEAEAGLAQASADFGRARSLFEAESLTKADFDGARARLDSVQARRDAAHAQLAAAEARIAAAAAQLDEAGLALRDSALRAPMDGVVVKKIVEVGALAGPGTPAFVLAATRTVRAIFGVPDVAVEDFRLGQEMTITTEAAPGVAFAGRVDQIAPAADPRSRVFEVAVLIPNPQEQLRPGMIASLEVPAGKAGAPLTVVPLSAIVRSREAPDRYALSVVEEQDGRQIARLRTVTLGEALGNLIVVTDGVTAGERVVISGASLVTSGEEVRIVQ